MYFSSVLFLELMFRMWHVSKHNQNWYFWPLRLKSITNCQADLPICAHYKHPVLLSGYLTRQIWYSLIKLNSALHKVQKDFYSLCHAITHLHTATDQCWGPSPGNAHLKAQNQECLRVSVAQRVPGLTGYLFSASWTWATGECVTMK